MLDRTKGPERAAELRYLSGDFQIVRLGSHVICAISGKVIPLEELRYWNADLQEAYATAQIATERIQEIKSRGKS